MKFPRSPLAAATIAAVSVLLASCGTDDTANRTEERFPVEYRAHESNDSAARISILAHGSTFKTQIVQRLVDEFRSQDMSVVIDDLANWQDYPAVGYNAVVLLSGIEGFRALPEAAEYIKANDYAANIVYFFPYTLTKWPYGHGLARSRIDAITAASAADDAAAVTVAAWSIIDQVDAILDR